LNKATIDLYKGTLNKCEKLFKLKLEDYGMAWRVLRLTSITDQILIKIERIRTIFINGTQAVNDNIEDDLIGIINYSIMAVMQTSLIENETYSILEQNVIFDLYEEIAKKITSLFLKKNQDYGESWRIMRFNSILDIMLMKIMRLKNIEDKGGKTLISEGIEANYQDIANYAIIACIKLNEK
jgi:hypothetical protein